MKNVALRNSTKSREGSRQKDDKYIYIYIYEEKKNTQAQDRLLERRRKLKGGRCKN
jgi:hypothetical protein